jgi:hypothetical protein
LPEKAHAVEFASSGLAGQWIIRQSMHALAPRREGRSGSDQEPNLLAFIPLHPSQFPHSNSTTPTIP